MSIILVQLINKIYRTNIPIISIIHNYIKKDIMNHYITSMFSIRIILPFLCIYFSSCVYFNTFYNAENSFKQANEIIDNSSSYDYDSDEIPIAAKKLLKESISSSNIVISDYNDSKYVDDAIYYMARSYFSLSEFYKSEKYFSELVNNHPNSKYYNESRLWLEYSNLKLNILDSISINLLEIEQELISENNKKNKDLFFLLYNLKGDFFIKSNKFEEGFYAFEQALKFVNSKSKKTMLYSKLAYISESKNMFEKAAGYLDKIQIFSNNSETKIEALRKWIDVMERLKRYDDIILKIEDSINSSSFDTEKLQDEFNMELAIAYMNNKDFSKSKNLFNDIINSSVQRRIQCESYYWLGHISLIQEFDLELAKEYFDLVLETMRTSDFSKKTKQYLNEIKSYDRILNQYQSNDETVGKNDKNDKLLSNSNSFINRKIEKDSLLFIIAEKLYFDFNQSKMSIQKHKELIKNYPNSNYVSRSERIINQLEGVVDSLFVDNLDTLKFLRDSAWNIFDYDKKRSVDLFLEIATKYKDYQSYYSLGMIYENHLYKPDLGLKYYLESFNNTNDESFKNVLKNKLLLLEESIKNKVDTLNQKDNYVVGFDFLINQSKLDSALIYFNNSNKLKPSQDLVQVIDDYTKNINSLDFSEIKDSILNLEWKHKKYTRLELDSIFLDLANISFWFFRDIDLSKNYLDLMLINDSSKYYDSFSKLNYRIQNTNFKVDTTDKSFNMYLSKSKNYFDYYKVMIDSEQKRKDDLSNYNILLNYFLENLHNNELDTLGMQEINMQDMPIINNGIPNMQGNKMIPVDLDIKINNENLKFDNE